MESLSNMGGDVLRPRALNIQKNPTPKSHYVLIIQKNPTPKKINKHVPMVWPESTSIPDPTFIVKISTSQVHATSLHVHNTKNHPSQPTGDTQFNVQTNSNFVFFSATLSAF